MNVLFVAKSKQKNGEIAPFIQSQMTSLTDNGVNVKLFTIIGNGFCSYLIHAKKLNHHLKENKYDIIHAHYSLCGWTAVLSFPRIPIVLSLMGSDALGEFVSPGHTSLKSKIVVLLTLLIQPFVKIIISKSVNIEKRVFLKKKSYILPNGVNLQNFDPYKLSNSKDLASSQACSVVLFLNNPNHHWKNFNLAKKVVEVLSDDAIQLIAPYPIPSDQVANYLHNCIVLLNTSYMEGSPNIIKEAMAMNCPIVTTDVGDVKWVIGETTGCFVSSFDEDDLVMNLKLAIRYARTIGRTSGRQRIIELGLDHHSISQKLINLYRKVVKD